MIAHVAKEEMIKIILVYGIEADFLFRPLEQPLHIRSEA
jgi:hypothetical protein